MLKEFIKKTIQGRTEEKEKIFSILEKIFLFKELNWLELKKIETIIHERSYMPGEVIFNEGDSSEGMYVIKDGAVDVVRGTPTKEVKLGSLKSGDFFGEVSLLDEFPRSATVKATEKTEVLGFFRPDLLGLISREPRIGSKILLSLAKMMGERLRRGTTEEIEEVI